MCMLLSLFIALSRVCSLDPAYWGLVGGLVGGATAGVQLFYGHYCCSRWTDISRGTTESVGRNLKLLGCLLCIEFYFILKVKNLLRQCSDSVRTYFLSTFQWKIHGRIPGQNWKLAGAGLKMPFPAPGIPVDYCSQDWKCWLKSCQNWKFLLKDKCGNN